MDFIQLIFGFGWKFNYIKIGYYNYLILSKTKSWLWLALLLIFLSFILAILNFNAEKINLLGKIFFLIIKLEWLMT